MDSTGERGEIEIEESNGRNCKTRVSYPFDDSKSRETQLCDEQPRRWSIGSLTDVSSRIKLLKFGSPSGRFMRIAEERDEISRSVTSSSSHNLRERIGGMFSRKIDLVSLLKMSKQWLKNPINLALFIWIVVVAVSGAILFMVMTGMLNQALPKKTQRDSWFEVNNQILNALFTLMCLYQHPKRSYHLVLLCRWRPQDVTKLRKIYCKDGTYKPHEWAHMMVVVVLLHVNCFAQYALCGLNLGYRRSNRPAVGVAVCISVAIAAPAVAGLYSMLSPLGKDYDSGVDEENQVENQEGSSVNQRLRSLARRYSFASTDDERTAVSNPQWSGGILDFWDDISLAYLSLFCTFCVFGWNMERLGFGNMYVHIATFTLFCMAPFFIFNLAAINIDNETAREALGFTGIILCVFGFLYGGFWRIQMRKRFKLPSYDFCFGKPAIADCTLWLFCCWCSLAQEVRTGNSYEIVEDKFCLTREENCSQQPMMISPLPREGGVMFDLRSGTRNISASPKNIRASSSPSPSRFSKESRNPDEQICTETEDSCAEVKSHEALIPPSPPFIRRET